MGPWELVCQLMSTERMHTKLCYHSKLHTKIDSSTEQDACWPIYEEGNKLALGVGSLGVLASTD